MLVNRLFQPSPKVSHLKFNRLYAEFDCDPSTRDIESFLDFFFAFKDVHTLRRSIELDPFGENGAIVQRFFHMIGVYKVAYSNSLLIFPQEVFPIAGKEQRSAYLLNLGTAALYMCLENKSRSLGGYLLPICSSFKKCFMVAQSDDPNHWSQHFAAEAHTQAVICEIETISKFRPQAVQIQDAEKVKAILAAVSKHFGSATHVPKIELRTRFIYEIIKNRMTGNPNSAIEGCLQDLVARFPLEKFFQDLFIFIQNAYSSLQRTKQDKNGINDVQVGELRKKRRSNLHRKDRKRRKVYGQVQTRASDSDSDGEIREFGDINATQVPATINQHRSSEWSPSASANSNEKHEITSSLEKSQKSQVSPLTNSHQRYEFYVTVISKFSTNENLVHRKPTNSTQNLANFYHNFKTHKR